MEQLNLGVNMKRENQAKFKELSKNLMPLAKAHAKKYNFKTKGFLFWTVQNDFFFTFFPCISPGAKDENQFIFSSQLDLKPVYLDDIFWDVMDMSSNKNEPMSLRATGAFTVPGIYYFKNFAKMETYKIAELDKLLKDSIDSFANALLDLNGKEEEWFYKAEKELTRKSDARHLMIKLHFKQYAEALDYIKNSKDKSFARGGFSNNGKDLFERVIDYCKKIKDV